MSRELRVNRFTTTAQGLVPAPVTASGLFLRDDATWAAAGGTGGITDIVDIVVGEYFGYSLANHSTGSYSNFNHAFGGLLSDGSNGAGTTPGGIPLQQQQYFWESTGPNASGYAQIRNINNEIGVVNGVSGAGGSVNGGFRAGFVCGWESTGLASVWDSSRIFVGLVDPNYNTVLAAQNPSAFTNMIGIGKDATDTTLQFMTNDGAGAATKTSTGITASSLDTHLLLLNIQNNTAGTSCTVTITDKNTGVTANTTFATNLPASGFQICASACVGTAANTTPLRIYMNRFGYRAGF